MFPADIRHIMQRILTGLFTVLVSTISLSAAEHDQPRDSLTGTKRNIVTKIIDYFGSANKHELSRRPDFSIIGGPHYSSDTKFGIGLVAAGIYSTDPSDTTLYHSNFSLYGDISTAGFYMIGIRGSHIFPRDTRRINYDIYLSSFTTYFWGIGYTYNSSDKNKTSYKDLRFTISADYLWRIGRHIYAGPTVEYNFIRASDIKANEFLWEGESRSTNSYGIGVTARYDTRDHLTDPYSGWFIQIDQRFYPRFLFNGNYNFSATEIGINNYTSVWKGGVIASRAHLDYTTGHTPWGLLPSLGGSHTMRGYYEGRYRDKIATDVTIELRQHIYRRSGAVVWLGAGSIMENFSDFRWKDILPNAGIGYRWEFKKRTNVRLDLGFGKGEWGFIFNINEAF